MQAVKEEIDKLKRQIDLFKKREIGIAFLKFSMVKSQPSKKLNKAEKSDDLQNDNELFRTRVGTDEIAQVVSKATGIPVAKMVQGEREKLVSMETKLFERVVGQNEAVKLISDAIRRSRAGISDPDRPDGSFLFLGPTGVGKTELCKALAEFLFDSTDHLLRFDMTEFMEKHSVARLIGAPPGYVGYEDGGLITEAVRRRPYSLILLDEVEKAHPDVFNVLLQVLDDGRLTDGHGRTVDFKNTVIVMTSNLGSQKIQQSTGQEYKEIKAAVMTDVKEFFRPEFLNRIDETVVFHSLGRDQLKLIAKIQLDNLKHRLIKSNLHVEIDSAAIARMLDIGFDPLYGARPLKRAIQTRIENPLAKKILEHEYQSGDTIRISESNGQLVFT